MVTMAAGYIMIIPVPRVYLKYIPVVSFDVRCQSGIFGDIDVDVKRKK